MAKGNEPVYPCTKLEDVEKVFIRNDGREIRNTVREDVLYSGMSIRLRIASEKMDALLGKWNTSLATDTIVRRNPETDKGITGTEDFSESLRVMAKMALMATDTLLKLEEETRNE